MQTIDEILDAVGTPEHSRTSFVNGVVIKDPVTMVCSWLAGGGPASHLSGGSIVCSLCASSIYPVAMDPGGEFAAVGNHLMGHLVDLGAEKLAVFLVILSSDQLQWNRAREAVICTFGYDPLSENMGVDFWRGLAEERRRRG